MSSDIVKDHSKVIPTLGPTCFVVVGFFGGGCWSYAEPNSESLLRKQSSQKIVGLPKTIIVFGPTVAQLEQHKRNVILKETPLHLN